MVLLVILKKSCSVVGYNARNIFNTVKAEEVCVKKVFQMEKFDENK